MEDKFNESFHFVPEGMFFYAALDNLNSVKQKYSEIDEIFTKLKTINQKIKETTSE